MDQLAVGGNANDFDIVIFLNLGQLHYSGKRRAIVDPVVIPVTKTENLRRSWVNNGNSCYTRMPKLPRGFVIST